MKNEPRAIRLAAARTEGTVQGERERANHPEQRIDMLQCQSDHLRARCACLSAAARMAGQSTQRRQRWKENERHHTCTSL